MLTLTGLSGSCVIYVYHLFIFVAFVTPPQMTNTFVLFILVEMVNIFFFLCFLFLYLLCFCSRMGRPKSKKEKEKDSDAPKPRSRGSAHKGGDLNQWFKPQMQMAIDEYRQYKSFLFICKNILARIQELQTVCLRKSTLVNNFFPNETFPSWHESTHFRVTTCTCIQSETCAFISKEKHFHEDVFNLKWSTIYNCYSWYFRQCRKFGAGNVSISKFVKTFGIPKVTFWKRVTGRVIGSGHISDGKGQGKVLTKGKSNFLLSKCFTPVNVSVNKCNMFPFHFTSDDENDLATLIIKFARRGLWLTKRRGMSLAYQYAELNGRKGISKLTQ